MSSLQFLSGPEGMGRAVSALSLAPSARSESEHLKRMSCSEAALNKHQVGRLPASVGGVDLSLPGYVPNPNPRLLSRSHHNLGQLPESPEHRAVLSYGSQSQSGGPMAQLSSHHRACSDTDSITVSRQQDA